jgi:ferredoxin-type protein NapF
VASRRDFLKGFKKPLVQDEVLVLRPPYALNKSLFQSECTVCEDKSCVASCEEKIIKISNDGTPTLSFVHSGCTFCDDCANACDANVLSLEHRINAQKLNALFSISTSGCIAHNGVICFSCKEPCIDDAILFNGLFNPVIDTDKCTSCGFCLGRCPTQAIDFKILPLKEAS